MLFSLPIKTFGNIIKYAYWIFSNWAYDLLIINYFLLYNWDNFLMPIENNSTLIK